MKPIPNEVIAEIFKYVDQPDLLQLQLTCKRWGKVAQDVLYTKIIFKDRSVGDLELFQVVGTIETSPIKEELCKLVREINFTNFSSSSKFPTASLHILGKLYPNIQSI
jgi:hypothetical protein